jgi:hypothetical protein
MKFRRTTAVLAVAVALALSGCASAKQDRTGSAGSDPDQFGEATKVRVYTNADRVPNIAIFCVDDLAFWSGLNGDKAAASIGRLTEWDASYCGRTAR